MVALFFASLLFCQQTPPDNLGALLDEANLTTVSTLVKPDSVAARVQFVPRTLLAAGSLINANGQLRSTKAKETSLFNAYEKVVLAGKGVFTKPNNLGAGAFEYVSGEQGKQGKLVLYADSTFSEPLFLLRWNAKKNTTEYLFRTVRKNALHVETIELNRDGSGTYKLVIEKILRRHLAWNSDGRPTLDETL